MLALKQNNIYVNVDTGTTGAGRRLQQLGGGQFELMPQLTGRRLQSLVELQVNSTVDLASIFILAE